MTQSFSARRVIFIRIILTLYGERIKDPQSRRYPEPFEHLSEYFNTRHPSVSSKVGSAVLNGAAANFWKHQHLFVSTELICGAGGALKRRLLN